MTQGKGAGLASCLGVAIGGVAHVLAATFGLSALLASSTPAFSVVKYAGAAYLIWLGYRKLTQAPALDPEAPIETHSLLRVFQEGVLVNVLNPKTEHHRRMAEAESKIRVVREVRGRERVPWTRLRDRLVRQRAEVGSGCTKTRNNGRARNNGRTKSVSMSE